MIDVATASASTGLSPEWDRWFDEAFTDLITGDAELLPTEFDDLIASSWQSPPPGTAPAPAGGGSPPEGPHHDVPGNSGRPEPDPEQASRPPP